MARIQHTSRAFTVFLGAVSGISSLSIDMGLPAIPGLEHDLGLASGRGTLILSLFLLGFSIAPLISGPLSDKMGRRRLLLVGLAAFTLSALACALSPNFALLLTARLCQGCAAGTAAILPVAIVRDLLTGSAARKRMSEIVMVNGLVPIIAPLCGSAVISAVRSLPWHIASWRAISAVQATLGGVLTVVILLGFEESHPVAKRSHVALHRLLLNYREVFTSRIFVQNAMTYALCFGALFSYVGMSPTILMEQLGASSSQYAIMFACTGSGIMLGSMTSAAVSRRLGSHSVVRIGIGLMLLASLLAFALTHSARLSAIPLVACSVALVFGFGLSGATLSVEALAPIPHLAGAGAGALRSTQMITGSIASGLLSMLTSEGAGLVSHAARQTALAMLVCTAIPVLFYVVLPPPLARVSHADQEEAELAIME